jgi:hypothetical protein
MNYDWKKLVDKAVCEGELSPFFQAVYELARHAYGIRYEDKYDFAQFVCLMLLKQETLIYLFRNNFSSESILYQIKEFIRWRRIDWYRMRGNVEQNNLETIEDLQKKENEFLTQKAAQYELFLRDDTLKIRKFIENIIPTIKAGNLRADAKENAVKVFLLSQIFLGELFEDHNLDVVLNMLKIDLSKYGIKECDIGQYTIEEIAVRLGISTTAITNSISRIRETGVSLAKESDLNYSA